MEARVNAVQGGGASTGNPNNEACARRLESLIAWMGRYLICTVGTGYSFIALFAFFIGLWNAGNQLSFGPGDVSEVVRSIFFLLSGFACGFLLLLIIFTFITFYKANELSKFTSGYLTSLKGTRSVEMTESIQKIRSGFLKGCWVCGIFFLFPPVGLLVFIVTIYLVVCVLTQKPNLMDFLDKIADHS